MTVSTMERVQTTGRSFYELLLRNRRALRDALILIGLLRAAVYFFVQDIHPWTFVGIDARAYYAVDLAHPYVGAALGQHPGYLYSPAFAQFLSPLYVLPFEAFYRPVDDRVDPRPVLVGAAVAVGLADPVPAVDL